ncbi:MAG: D-alanyl-D-alanine carboxypeptidase/D-alanyl-D-alanine-endopeptidase [Bacteroidota bacterium]|nr:D-alanyl-D-alanine carboxypeptidase/D-alanyl-D-alanine-endopeptidase [Bacteroidota bacterium]
MKTLRIPRLIFLLLFCIAGMFSFRPSDGSAYIESAYIEKVNNTLKGWQSDPGFTHASWGFCMISLADGKQVVGFNEQKSLIPASALKAVTTATALDVLGPEYIFTTKLSYSGTLSDDSTLNGDIYIEGGGDPTLGYERVTGSQSLSSLMAKWALAIKSKGIKKITGSIVGDASYLDGDFPVATWGWNDIGNYFGAAPSGLAFHENQYTLFLQSGKAIGSPVKVLRTYPDAHIVFTNHLTTAATGSGDQAYIFGAPFSNERWLKGTIPLSSKSFAIEGSLPEPALTCARELKSYLLKKGIVITGDATTMRLRALSGVFTKASRNIFHTTSSPAMNDVTKTTNFQSINLYAEHLLSEIGKKQSGTGSTEEGLQALTNYWKIKGIDFKGVTIHDGSGLSRTNLVTPFFLATIVYSMRDNSSFINSLPRAGIEGTLKNVCDGELAHGKLWAKSGTMEGVRSYTGYVTNTQGQKFAFALIINNFDQLYVVQKKIENLFNTLAG